MQPPTEPSAHGNGRTPARRHGDEAELYRRYQRKLLRAVARAVSAPPELIEDACQIAWIRMLRGQPERATLFAWLRVVAIREAWTHSARARAEIPAGDFRTPYACELAPGEHPEPPADTRDVAEQVAARIQHAQRLADLATIKPNDRRALYLGALGYRYREIAKLSRGVRVNVAVLLGADVGDMSLMEASRLRFAVPRPRAVRRDCCSCLVATAAVLEFPPMASSHAPTSCLCIGCDGFGRVALLLVVLSRRLGCPSGDARIRTTSISPGRRLLERSDTLDATRVSRASLSGAKAVRWPEDASACPGGSRSVGAWQMNRPRAPSRSAPRR
jgi:DNA-directed RNA polymerase specialized sigma24 family protein